jgi:hypothetical protein
MLNERHYFLSGTTPTNVPIATSNSGDSQQMVAVARGNATLTFIDGRTVILHDTLYFPLLTRNLISFAQLMKQSAAIDANGDC